VFTPERSGFDALVGNPPWDVMKPYSHEFFSDFDPLYRTYDKQEALRKQRDLFETVPGVSNQWHDYSARFKSLANWARNAAHPFDLALAKGKEGSALASVWANRRQQRQGFAHPEHPFRLQGSADLNSYKMFTEVFWGLLRESGRLGILVPSGIYTDSGSRDLRDNFFRNANWEWLFSFENRRKVFAIDERFKFAVLIIERHYYNSSIRAAFMVQDLSTWGQKEPPVFEVDNEFVALSSPRNRSILEVRSERDLTIFRKMFSGGRLLGDDTGYWKTEYARELHVVDDSRLLPPVSRWIERGYFKDAFDEWSCGHGASALPIIEGRHIGQFEFAQKGWLSGRGRTAVWRNIPCDGKTINPQFLISKADYFGYSRSFLHPKLVFMDVASSTNTRTFFGCVIPSLPLIHKAPALRVNGGQLAPTLALCAICNSLSFDYVIRTRMSGLNVGWFVLEECPIPRLIPSEDEKRFVQVSAQLCFLHRRFAPEWLKLKHLYPELGSKDWKHWWAVTDADRLRLRVEIDALCADLYGLAPDDFDWIVRDDPSDPKGFYRVDRRLPFRERLTALAAAAFRALKEGKWSAETAASLSNDEFFETLGIPELTNAQAAHTKSLPGPLIAKRDGCHVWKPENFPEDDPRHGWTWDDCWNDAVALLGNEEAVRQYVEGETEASKSEAIEDGAYGLRNDPQRSKQGKLF